MMMDSVPLETAVSDSGSEDRSSPTADSLREKEGRTDDSNVRSTSVKCNVENGDKVEYYGWVYHLGTNPIGHEFCHYRFLFIRGCYMEMYKRDLHENPGIKPIRKGVIGDTLMVEDLGCREVSHNEVYVLRFYNRLDQAKRGEIACATAYDAKKWKEAFDHAKQQGQQEISKGGSVRDKLTMEDEINLEGPRAGVRKYAHGLRWLVRRKSGDLGSLSRKALNLHSDSRLDMLFDTDTGDVVDGHEWKCVRTINGVRIFEDVAASKGGKGVLVKAVGVVDASADTVFEVLLSSDRLKRYEWDTLTGDIELVDSVNGHYDVVYGTFDPRYLTWRHSKRDFVFSRRWFRDQEGTYTILQFPSVHKKRPSRSGYKRTKINPTTWEIRKLSSQASSSNPRCLVTQTLEINPRGWLKWRNNHCPKFERTVPYALLSQVAGLKEYIEANPAITSDFPGTKIVDSEDLSQTSRELESAEKTDEFYDATADAESSSDSEDSESDSEATEETNLLKSGPQSVSCFSLIQSSESSDELDSNVPSINLEPSEFPGTMRRAVDEDDKNCWISPSGSGFMIRGKTYLKDSTKIKGGQPLLKLIAVDWFKVEGCLSNAALHPRSLVQSEQGKKLPFILVVNLQIPSKPNYSLVMYHAADRPVREDSLLGKFIDGTDAHRDSRFKLIPSIIEGYWMVKRAVGTKACMLGKAINCKYLRQDNFLEIDVDIGSSSVAKSVIGLVLGYVTSIVVDLAMVIEGKEESELPEYILGTIRLNRVQLDTAESI
ncbi:protein ENHANCED DISEASE RESISTANCE 2-like [Andrographis paniculata]|uniref:protein ENHANCED DISEASE RESISTANCE 2-like n=1 Tax=Andrographis paniculata TaxID=175694 RepID=UPI0021E737CB|nr:protein ENHANCED DISEASE RESISTANCE 2-like [Andrographis paniculata]